MVKLIGRKMDQTPPYGAPRSLLVAAQVSCLAGMAFCYFLFPQCAWAYPVLAVGWFLGLALPTVTMGPRGVAGKRLVASAAGRCQLPGSLRFTVRAAARSLIYPGWPAIVAAVLPPPSGARSADPMMAIGLLTAAAGVLVGVVTLAGPRHAQAARWIVLATAAIALGIVSVLPRLP
jgi:hypothetical protein